MESENTYLRINLQDSEIATSITKLQQIAMKFLNSHEKTDILQSESLSALEHGFAGRTTDWWGVVLKLARNSILLLFAISVFSIGDVLAISPEEVLVVVNRRMAGAQEIANYYMEKRAIPKDNLVTVKLSVAETLSRDEFVDNLLPPIQEQIKSRSEAGEITSAIVLVYGVPLKVEPPFVDWKDQETIEELKRERGKIDQAKDEDEAVSKRLKEIAERINTLSGHNKRAAVDSELMLAKKDHYELDGWLENPYFIGFQRKPTLVGKNDVMVVARLDGPDEKTVYRLIDDTLAAEKEGLHGKAYFDARWPNADVKDLGGYRRWDASLHRAAALVENRMDVHLDQEEKLLAPGSAPDAALYCGWYSLARYVDSFTWVRGAVGYHIASAECSTLKKIDSQVWCLQMLNHGVAVTIGPVYEPYVQGFPLPEIFFGVLVDGYMDLGESYLVSLPFISWQMVLVGDPLYRPFRPLPAQK